MTEKHKTHEEIIAQRQLEQHEVKEVLHFVKKYGNPIGYAIAALLAAVAVTSLLHAKKAQNNAVAGQLLMSAGSDEELQLIIDKHADTAAAPGALLALARRAFNQGEYDKAQATYNRFLKKHSNHDMAAIAAFGQAACLEAQDNLDAAATEYQMAADNYRGSFITPMALFHKGKLLAKQDKKEEAIKAFEDTIAADVSGVWFEQAQSEMSKLR